MLEKLKELALAYELAEQFDYVPTKSEYIEDEIFKGFISEYGVDRVNEICDDYEGSEPSDISENIIRLIKKG